MRGCAGPVHWTGWTGPNTTLRHLQHRAGQTAQHRAGQTTRHRAYDKASVTGPETGSSENRDKNQGFGTKIIQRKNAVKSTTYKLIHDSAKIILASGSEFGHLGNRSQGNGLQRTSKQTWIKSLKPKQLASIRTNYLNRLSGQALTKRTQFSSRTKRPEHRHGTSG